MPCCCSQSPVPDDEFAPEPVRDIKGEWKVNGKTVRADPDYATVEDFPDFKKLEPEKAQAKLDLVKEGAAKKAAYPPFPSQRKWQDVAWLVAFAVTTLVVWGGGFLHCHSLMGLFGEMSDEADSEAEASRSVYMGGDTMTGAQLLFLFCVAGLVALAATVSFIVLAYLAPGCLVWSSLVLGPALTIAGGIMFIALGTRMAIVIGVILIVGGVFSLAIHLCCFMDYIPFTIQVIKVVADIIRQHPCMITVGMVGSVLSFVWVVGTCLSFASIFYHYDLADEMQDSKPVQYTAIFVTTLVFTWGCGVACNVCHVTFCGVFGRWYYGSSEGTLAPSLLVATTTSLGSICFGSLLVALARAAEKVAKQMMEDAQEDANVVLCVISCVLMCILSLLGDILEYFNDWAYVQCAVRGVSFLQAASITFSMMTCANVKYIISDLLLSNVVNLGILMIAMGSMMVTCAVGFALYGTAGFVAGLFAAFLIGGLAGSSATGVINSGVKTLLVCWAENPEPLSIFHPELHDAFSMKISKVADDDEE